MTLAAEHESQDPEVSASVGQEFDYRELRREVGDVREGKTSSEKILGLPTEEFYTPVEPATLREAINSGVATKTMKQYVRQLRLNQGGAIGLFLVVLLVLALNIQRIFSFSNLDVLMLPAVAFLMVDLVPLGTAVSDPHQRALAGAAFTGILLVSLYWVVRSLVGVFRSGTPLPRHLPLPLLAVLAAILLGVNALQCLLTAPDDCGIFTNIGAKRMLETGRFPYGDPKLRGGAAATYGPVLYLSHIPFQLALSASTPNEATPQKERESEEDAPFVPPPILATKLCQLFFHVTGLFALIAIGRQIRDMTLGLTLACLYASSAYVQGLGGTETVICGMPFISHIAPTAVMLLSFAFLHRPLISGILLAVATGVLFFPAFCAPAWLGYYFWRREGTWQFLLGFVGCLALIGGSVLLLTESTANENSLQVVFRSTVAHQEHPDLYGSSPFSFWGTHSGAMRFWQRPIVEGWFMLKPAFMCYLLLVGISFFLARRCNRTQFAFLVVALNVGVQLWKSHATGTYVEWYLPFLLIGIFANSSEPGAPAEAKPNDTH